MRSQTLSFHLTPVTARAYDFLKASILAGKLKPGQFLSAGKLSAEIGISRTPIKDALRYLQNDGLVSIEPRMGAVVTSFDEEELREMLGYRKALETYAVEEACRMPHDSDLTDMDVAMRNLREKIDSAVPETLGTVIDLCLRFHGLIVKSARNGQIARRFQALQQMLHIYVRGDAFTGEGELEMTRQEVSDFVEILAAIRAGNGLHARQILGENLDRSAALILAYSLGRSADGAALDGRLVEASW